jgi:hypothetical protein
VPNPYLITLISVIVGAVLGAAGAMIPKLWGEKKALASAIAGEVQAILEIIERRGYLEHANRLLGQVKTANQAIWLEAPVTLNYMTVYEANATKIGLLPRKAAHNIAIFYTTIKSLIEDVTDENHHPKTEEDARQRLLGIISLLHRAFEIGRQIPKDLDAA